MYSSTYRFTLDLHSTVSQISLPVTIGDTNRAFNIRLADGGLPYTIEDGCVAMITFKRPGGTVLHEFCSIERNTLISYNFSQNANTAAEEGLHTCELVLYSGNIKIRYDENGDICTDEEGNIILDENGEILASPWFTMIVSGRAAKDTLDLSSEDKNVVDAMYVNEAARLSNEEARSNAEKERDEAEIARYENEYGNLEKGIVGRKYAEIAREEAEKARKEAENGRKTTFEANESERQATFGTNESARQESYERAEENRGLSYTEAENQRNVRYESAESKRDTYFNDNESDRQSIFGRAEEDRASSYTEAENQRDDLYESAENTRQEDFNKNEAQRETNETTRISKENERISKENERISNENIRIAAENTRNSRYEEAENSRNSAYSTAENTRNSRYESAESVRNTSYIDAEENRDEWYHDAENQRDDLYEKAEGTRWEDFNQSETLRDAGEKARVEAEEKRSVFYKDFNSRITQIENHIDPKYYITSAERAYERIVPANACPYIEINDIGTGLLSIDGSNKYSTEKPCDNLIPFPYAYTERTINGVTFTPQSDGGVKLKGKATASALFRLVENYSTKTGAPLTLSGGMTGISVTARKTSAQVADAAFLTASDSSVTGTLANGESLLYVGIYIANGTNCDAVIYPMLNYGSTALPYEPYYEGTKSTKVTAIESYGANLVDDEAFFKKAGFTKQSNGYWLGSNKTIPIFTNTERKAGSMSVAYMSKTLTANGTNNSVALALIYYTEGSPEYKALTTNGSTDYGRRTYTTDADRTVTEIWLSHGIPGTFEIKDLIINWGGVVDYKPYSAEPLFTYNIPKAIQDLPGYGMGLIDFENKKFIQYDSSEEPLLQPIEHDISAALAGFDNTLEVQAGGTLRFINEAKGAIPSTISYLAKEGTV